MTKSRILFIILVAAFAYWWITSTPPKDLIIGPAFSLGEVPKGIKEVEADDIIAKESSSSIGGVPGHDDIAFQDSSSIAFLSGMDGWIWKVDKRNSSIEKVVKVPLIPTGMQIDPSDQSMVYFCSSRMGGKVYANDEKVGLYLLNTSTNKIQNVILRLPKIENNPSETTFLPSERPTFKLSDLNEENSREFCLCNDLAISKDGQRIYISEPVTSPRAAMGSGAVIEAIGLAPIGKMWLYDKTKNTISLVVDNFTFVDGLTLYYKDSVEQAILFTETTKFRIFKTYLSGEEAGTTTLLWDNLPGMPDGMDRDVNGNIWIGLIKKRSNLIGWIHNNPWIKPFFLRLPQSMLPVSKETGILALSPNGETALYYSNHDGSKLSDISVVSPKDSNLYFPIFNLENKGLHSIKNPLLISN